MAFIPDPLPIGGVRVPHPIAIFGTAAVLILWWFLAGVLQHAIARGETDSRERYRKRQVFSTVVAVLPITYDSNADVMTQSMLKVGGDYSREFLKGAEAELEKMKSYFLVPSVELKPNVYMKVTDNWLELHMRYVVDPKKRRAASYFIYSEIFKVVQGRKDIAIASSTMDLTLHGQEPRSSREPQPPDDSKAA